MPLYRGWKFVKCQIEGFENKNKKKDVYITILLFTGTLRSSLNTKNVLFEKCKMKRHNKTNKQTKKKKRNEVVWVLLLVHITLHGMIGGLLKHFPKAVCGIIFFICLKKKKKKKKHF